jgi:hypothetical protein
MFIRRFLCILFSLTLLGALYGQAPAGGPAPSSPAVTPPSEKQSFQIYLLMGQSNMCGRDTTGMENQVNNPHILSLDQTGRWVIARDPLHQQDGRIPPGIGPGMSFARATLSANPNITIGLVPCAVGGTPLRRWVKGGNLYEKAVQRAKLAAQSGVLAGVLWHQGETDTTNQENANSYDARLTAMFADLRTDLGSPNLPIVVGQLGPYLDAAKYPFVDTVRAAIKYIPTAIPHVGYADSTGLTDKGDKLHFNADSQRVFGARYAAAMQALQSAK